MEHRPSLGYARSQREEVRHAGRVDLALHLDHVIRERDLDMICHLGTRSRRAGTGREHLSRGQLQRALLGGVAGRAGPRPPLPAILGIHLDADRNARHDAIVSTECTVRVVPTDEDLMIARHTCAVLQARA
jgi:hypothetical protein